jgi:methionine-rich copper-binding protein CopC
VESTSADGAALDRAPERVTLRFNEPVRVIFCGWSTTAVELRRLHKTLKPRRIE